MNINDILGKFSAGELKKVNEFLNSPRGKRAKEDISAADKTRLIRQLAGMDSELVKSKLNGLTKDDILKMLKGSL